MFNKKYLIFFKNQVGLSTKSIVCVLLFPLLTASVYEFAFILNQN